MRRVPTADRARRARRRRTRERSGALARARLGRLRRAAREPHARARARAGGGRTCDEAAVHAGSGCVAAWGGGGGAGGVARRDAGGVLLASQPGGAGVRGARRRTCRVRAGSRRRAPRLAFRFGARAEGAGTTRRGCGDGCVLRRRRRVRRDPLGARVDASEGVRRGRVRDRARRRRDSDRASGTAASPRQTRRTRRRRSAERRSSLCGSRKPTSARGTAACRTTREPRSSSVSVPCAWRGRAAWTRPSGSRTGTRSMSRTGATLAVGSHSTTWAAGPTRIHGSSRRRSEPVVSHARSFPEVERHYSAAPWRSGGSGR